MQIQNQLEQRLASLTPSVLEIINESRGHGGYFEGKESHFKVTIVSDAFVGLRAVQRHQKVYALAGDLLAPAKIHALAIHAYTPDEWTGQSPNSPKCMGGSQQD
ncbi:MULTISPECIES: BolA family protein [unclassified Acinetobacter]|uniref:BolA family protein n=1 Tax=unclassified Acinetobacter TaxID=196816 RepID=UPI0035BA7D64